MYLETYKKTLFLVPVGASDFIKICRFRYRLTSLFETNWKLFFWMCFNTIVCIIIHSNNFEFLLTERKRWQDGDFRYFVINGKSHILSIVAHVDVDALLFKKEYFFLNLFYFTLLTIESDITKCEGWNSKLNFSNKANSVV